MQHRWRIWELDAELRYQPVVDALPGGDAAVCEIGSGPVGLTAWTTRHVVGIDPGPDDKHGDVASPGTLERIRASGDDVPLEDRSVAATVAVDVLEHAPPAARRPIVDEMVRITADGGRVILMGPVGPEAAAADRRLLDRLHGRGVYGGWTVWLEEHLENGLPALDEVLEYLAGARVRSIRVRGVFNLRLWWTMHLVAMGALPRLDRVHEVVWGPVAALARRVHTAPCYRTLVVADLD
jgi:SAM-dependent methyltransferase